MSNEYQDASWTEDDITVNEGFISAATSPGNNTTQYFSMLEDTSGHDDTTDISVQLDTTLDGTAPSEMLNDGSALLQQPDQVMLYRIQGSDDMYAVQVAEDENGKLQKYQFKVRPTPDGQYEAVQDTITVIPFDASDPIIPHILDEQSTILNTVADSLVEQHEEHLEMQEEQQQVSVKCEQHLPSALTDGEKGELAAETNEMDADGVENCVGDGTMLGEDERLELENGYQYEETEGHLDSKEGILHPSSNHQHELPSNHEFKLEYYRDQDSNNVPSDDDENHLHLNISKSHDLEPAITVINNDDNTIEHKVTVDHQQLSTEKHEHPAEEQEDEELYSQLNHEDEATGMLADGIEYVGVEEPVFDASIVDESTQLEQGQEIDEQCQIVDNAEGSLSASEGEEGTEYILATGLHDGEIVGENGGIEYQQIFVTNDDQLTTPIKTYLDASQLQQLTLAAAASNNNQLPPNAAYIVTKIINENQSITTTATSLDQGVKFVRSLKIKRIGNPPASNVISNTQASALVVASPITSPRIYSPALRLLEKENVSNVNSNVISNMLKPNPRSILKASHIILRKPEQQMEADHMDKRFARSKELQRKRMFRDYIAQTTILQAPVRQERLPRKQLIKPVQRTDEEIIVREMVITSNGNGFIETFDDKTKENYVSNSRSYEQLSDSDSDFKPYNNGKRKRKYRKKKQQNSEATQSPEEVESDDSVMSKSLQDAIDLSADSEGEEIVETIIINSTGKRRGRPPKTKADVSSPNKRRGRPPKNQQSSESVSPPEETIRIIPSTEHKCTLCSKVFPSVGSLRSHMNFHKYMEEKPDFKVEELEDVASESNSVPENKYSCSKCNSTFKNAILLTKHVALHDNKDKFECKVCKKVFSDNVQLIAHKKSHIKDHMFQSTQISPQRRAKAVASFKCFVCNKSFSTTMLLEAHTKTHKNIFSCGNCSRNFMSKILLDKHLRVECVKRRSTEGNKRISFIVKPTLYKQPSSSSSVFAKPNANTFRSRRTTLRSMSSSSKEEINHIDKASASVDSDFASVASSASVLRTPANSKETSDRVVSSNIRSSALPLNLKCDECDEVFNTFQMHYKHKVLTHSMVTSDISINAESEKRVKRRIHKPIPGHSGVPANANLAKAFAALQDKMKHL